MSRLAGALWGALAATTAIMGVHRLVAQLAARSQRLPRVVEGAGIPLASGGKANRPAFRAHAISQNDLADALRTSGVENLRPTRLVTLEPGGKISVPKPE